MQQKRKKSRIGRFIRRFFTTIGILLLYILIGGIVPFIYQKDVSDEYKESYQRSDYYSDSVSVDRAAIVETSKAAMDIRLLMINSAKDKILLSTFSMKPDEACSEVCAALYAAAERGVKVEILIDGLSGSWDMKYNAMFYALGTHENVTMKYYNFFYLYAPWTFNGRLHDKFIVVDDKKLLLGGRNTSNYFLGNYNQDVLSYDREVFVYNTADTAKNSVISQVQDYFSTLWNCKVSRVAYDKVPWYRKEKVEEATQNYQTLYADIKQERPELWSDSVDYEATTVAVNHIELVSNPINIMGKEPQVWYTLEQLMKDAKEQVLIQSPYVVMNDMMYDAFEEIGADLTDYEILLNSIAVGDNICASSDYKYSREDVLATGIDVYEYQGEHSMHNKSLVIDHRLSVIGSFNFDMRSVYLDTETMLVIDGEEFAAQLENNIQVMQEESLLTQTDGTYVENPLVEAVEVPDKKRTIFRFLPFILRPFRFLL